MQRYIAGRALQSLVTLLAVSAIVFFLARLSGDPVELLLSIDATERDRALLTQHLGLDKPLYVQYVVFLADASRGDFGKSLRGGRSVNELILARFPATIQLGLLSMLIGLAISLPVGVYAAVRRGGVFDFVARTLAVLGQSVPPFWVGIILMQVFATSLNWLPTSGSDGPANFVLPAFTLGWYVSAGIMRLTRSSMLDVLDSDYVRLARIKGVPEIIVVWKHALKNALLPVITYALLVFVMLLGGTIIVEAVFAWPGVGRLLMESVTARDFPVIQALVLILSVLYVGASLLADIFYAYLNPRIRYGRT